MNPELQRIYDSTPEDEPRSRLDPYRELILRWRRQGRTYRRIQRLLAEQFAVKVSAVMICKYARSRSRPREVPEPEIDQPAPPDQEPMFGEKKLTPEQRAAQVEFIRSLNKPALEDQQPKPRWNFDVDKPRTIHKP